VGLSGIGCAERRTITRAVTPRNEVDLAALVLEDRS
jgi:hypothetical protein